MNKTIHSYNEHGFKIIDFDPPSQSPAWHSTIKRRQRQRAWVDHWASQPFDYFVTIAFNDTHSIDFAHKSLRRWHKHVDRRVVGSGHYKKPTHERIFFVAMFEHLYSNLHAHMLLRLPDPARGERFEACADREWQALIPKGDVHLSALDAPKAERWVAAYASKGLMSNKQFEAAMISDCNTLEHFTD